MNDLLIFMRLYFHPLPFSIFTSIQFYLPFTSILQQHKTFSFFPQIFYFWSKVNLRENLFFNVKDKLSSQFKSIL